MKNLPFAFLVICSAICLAQSFKCYQCGVNEGESYTTEQCEKVQTNVECPAHLKVTCYKEHIIKEDGTEIEKRGCNVMSSCEAMKENCENDAKKKQLKIEECAAACCKSEGDKPCNGAVTVFVNMITMLVAVVCSLRLV